MVRINLINPEYLTDQHLIAEYRELPRIFTLTLNHSNLDNIPKEFTLNKGHMNFFKNKLSYLKIRHFEIYSEMIKRGFNPKFYLDIKPYSELEINKYFNNYKPTKDSIIIIKERILSKIKLKPQWYRYYGKNYNMDFYNKMYSKIK